MMASLHELRAPADIQRDVDAALVSEVGRFLDSHGGAVATASVSDDGDVTLSFKGACRACPAAATTFFSKVAPVVRSVPGVRSVTAPNVNISEAAVRRIHAMFIRKPGETPPITCDRSTN